MTEKTEKTEKKTLTAAQARGFFDRACRRLHEAGYNVLAAIGINEPGGSDFATKVLYHGLSMDRAVIHDRLIRLLGSDNRYLQLELRHLMFTPVTVPLSDESEPLQGQHEVQGMEATCESKR